MELIVISKSKLKIMLTEPDMQHYQLKASCINCADAHTHEAFRHIIDDARGESGFDTEGKRLFIQLYTSKEGGCEIFVTKLDNFSHTSLTCSANRVDKEERTDIHTSSLSVKAQNSSKGEKMLLEQIYQNQIDISGEQNFSGENSILTTQKRRFCVQYTNLENLLISCRRLLQVGYREQNSVYIEETDHGTIWYLFLCFSDYTSSRLPTRFSFLTEYGQVKVPDGLDVFLSEYGRCLLGDNAVATFGKL